MKFKKLQNLMESYYKMVIMKPFYSMSFYDKPLKVSFFRNPSLNELRKGVRGIITRDGNLYIADSDEILHQDILKGIGISPEEVIYFGHTYIRVQRYENTNEFCLAESGISIKPALFKEYVKSFKKKNPNLSLFNQNILNRIMMSTQ